MSKWGPRGSDQYRAAMKEYHRTHWDRIMEHKKAWVKRNPEKAKSTRKKSWDKWYAKNCESVRESKKERKLGNRHLYNEYECRRRAARRKQVVAMGDRASIQKVYKRASELRRWFDVEVDHVVPLSKGGAHTASNLQIIYAYENARKQSFLDYKPRVVFK